LIHENGRAIKADDGATELFDCVADVRELSFRELAGVCVEHCYLLLSRVRIASHQDHELGLLFRDAVGLGPAETTSNVGPFS
jgi:hypothetical protein